MSGCKIKKNLTMGSGSSANCSGDVKDKNCSTEINNKLAALLAEREKQDASLNVVLSEKEYEQKYGSQPEGNVKK
jgi:hypothetical protein